jgi:hypothetical protein
MVPPPHLLERLSRRERVVLALFLGSFVLFGLLVEKRSAFMRRRMGDLGCYLRAGYAVRVGGTHLYDYTDDNGWHYNYPPLFAVLMAPLADPPARDLALGGAHTAGLLAAPGGAGPWLAASALAANPTPLEPDVPPAVPYVPYAVSVAVWYVVSLVCLALAVHLLAGALEQTSPHPGVRALPAGCRRWWQLRTLPVLVCLPSVGHTLMRGQANLLLLALLCGLIAALLRGRPLRAGLCLAGGICLKIFPAYLLLVPLWRRDARCLAGCLLGLVLGLGVVPAAALGPGSAVARYRELAEVLLGPALNLGGDRSRAKELIEVTATDSQSFLATLHNTLHLDRDTRPNVASPAVRRAHWILGGLFTLLTLAAGRRCRTEAGPALALFVGALTLIMILLSPVCHTHYFALSVPLVMGLQVAAWDYRLSDAARWALLVVMVLQVVGHALPLLPIFEVLKDAGLALYTALALWLAGCLVLWRGPLPPAATQADRGRAAAA